MKNPYKRTDIFRCNYSSHGRFEDKVSAYHVLQAKRCFPQGCIYFHWSCSRKNKGLSCKRGYHYVGRLCQGCSFYQDEKRHCQPKIVAPEDVYRAFAQEREVFDEWLTEMTNRRIPVSFCVQAVKPRFIKEIDRDHGHVHLSGYLLVMSEGFFDRDHFQDAFYALISPGQQEQLAFAPGDEVEAQALLKTDRGRLILTQLRAVHFETRSGAPAWTNSQALVAKAGATYFPRQSGNCLHCPHGALVDVTETWQGGVRERRDLYCLAGVQDQRECHLYALHKVDVCWERA